jgi:hypothetical protein
MDKQSDKGLLFEREPAIAGSQWEATWSTAGSAFDPSYDRATAVLRRWVDGMEAALNSAGAEAPCDADRDGSVATDPGRV